jgi:hypothetical protein
MEQRHQPKRDHGTNFMNSKSASTEGPQKPGLTTQCCHLRICAACAFAQPCPSSRPAAPTFSLQNSDGFWELTFDGEHTVLKQGQGLFYIAWLLTHPFSEPLTARALAMKVHETFGDHPDFQQVMPWLGCELTQAPAVKSLLRRQDFLETIIYDPDECEPSKREALRELEHVQSQQQKFAKEIIGNDHQTAEIVSRSLFGLLNSLTTALDCRGNPHRIARAFALHLLLEVFMPSARRGGYVYEPMDGTSWSGSVRTN